jgi:hypothetical protein
MHLNMRGASTDKQNVNVFLYATTDADGYFEFKPVPPGDYWLGYHLLNSPLQEGQPYARTYLPGVNAKALATIINVKEGDVLSDLTLQLPPPLTQRVVSGVVVWSDGQPAPGASVYLSLMEEGEMSSFSSVLTDENGRFTLHLYQGLQYKASAYLQSAPGKHSQSEYIEIPMATDRPLRLVLPLLRN